MSVAAFVFDPKPFVGGDNAGYLILAESIQTGQGYRDLHLPGTPRHATSPPLYPLVLALARGVGSGLLGFKALSIVFTALSVILLYFLARRRLGATASLAVAAAFAINPVLLYYSHWTLPEPLFVLLALAALWSAETSRLLGRSEESTDSGVRLAWAAGAAALASLAYLTRGGAIPLVLAILIVLGWRRRWRALAASTIVAALAVGGWQAWRALAVPREAAASGAHLLSDPANPDRLAGPGELVTRFIDSVRVYLVDLTPQSIAGVPVGGGVNPLALMCGLLVIALALVAWIREVRRVRPVEFYAALYALWLFLWPWNERRLLLALLPVLYLLAAQGLLWCLDFARFKSHAWAVPAFAALLVMVGVPHHVRALSFAADCRRLYREGDRLACYPPPWRGFFQAAAWARANTPEGSTIVSPEPRLFYLVSDRQGDEYPPTADTDSMLAFLDSVSADYVVVAAVSPTTFRYLVPVLRAMPERFEPVHAEGEGTSAAYLVAYLTARPQESP
ncbi:MAG: hypothetical protein GWN32_10065 [Gemmatimonadetes bacterium]|uniref:Glycosyltransferase RgtA/B/C/D-like domain-containing protein n=1 Tax=Candidatus Kutchimonas denitrificans TaxID=3056748 RepID=A0AAE4Z9Y0_9BACT|nr:hypothetical protein [Candidatus Kutchimonas denitrificans]NIW36853.1 hypothetical protein [Gemmatimonadota bacterium]